MGVSENSGTPKSSILIGFSIVNHPVWGTPIFGNTQNLKPPPRLYTAAQGTFFISLFQLQRQAIALDFQRLCF